MNPCEFAAAHPWWALVYLIVICASGVLFARYVFGRS